jgi:hypothetical protein
MNALRRCHRRVRPSAATGKKTAGKRTSAELPDALVMLGEKSTLAISSPRRRVVMAEDRSHSRHLGAGRTAALRNLRRGLLNAEPIASSAVWVRSRRERSTVRSRYRASPTGHFQDAPSGVARSVIGRPLGTWRPCSGSVAEVRRPGPTMRPCSSSRSGNPTSAHRRPDADFRRGGRATRQLVRAPRPDRHRPGSPALRDTFVINTGRRAPLTASGRDRSGGWSTGTARTSSGRSTAHSASAGREAVLAKVAVQVWRIGRREGVELLLPAEPWFEAGIGEPTSLGDRDLVHRRAP